MRSSYKNRKIVYSLVVLILLVATLYLALPANPPAGNPILKNVSSSSPVTASGFDKSANPTDEAASLWVVVNKGRALPSTYVPAGLVVPNVPLRLSNTSLEMTVRTDTARALEALFAGAKTAGLNLQLASGYRSYNEQVSVYAGYVKTSGQTAADTYSARPGHSEHQTGLAADLEPTSRNCELDQCFGDTPEGKWLALNTYKYGFVIRYQKTTQNLTGYEYEPWHVRYVGIDLAAQLNKTDQTLEQFFSLPIYKGYPAQSLTLKM